MPFFALGCLPNGQHSVIRQRTPLRYSSGMGHLKVCRCLVHCKADIHAKDSECATHSPHAYSKTLSFFFIRSLCWANFSFFFCSQATALHWSSKEGRLDVCQLLVGSKADVNASDKMCDAQLSVALLKCRFQFCFIFFVLF